LKEQLKEFVKTFQTLYGENAMAYNVHLILHLSENVENCGPLWTYSNFCFESKNGYLRREIIGSTDVVKQLTFNISHDMHSH
jgi:hypothetical protein